MTKTWKIASRHHLEQRVGRSEYRHVSRMDSFSLPELETIVAALNGESINRDLLAALEDAATALHSDRNHEGRFWDCDLWGCSSANAAIDKAKPTAVVEDK